jgi:hypothetical protein
MVAKVMHVKALLETRAISKDFADQPAIEME